MTDKLNITIRIAGQKPMTLSIDREYEETARNAEYQVNRLFGLWSERFRDKSHPGGYGPQLTPVSKYLTTYTAPCAAYAPLPGALWREVRPLFFETLNIQ